MRVIGLISGTSHDGVDGCHVEFVQNGTSLEARIVASDVVPYPAELRERIAAALPPNPTTVAEVCALDILIGEHFARVATALDASRMRPCQLARADRLPLGRGRARPRWAAAGQPLATGGVDRPPGPHRPPRRRHRRRGAGRSTGPGSRRAAPRRAPALRRTQPRRHLEHDRGRPRRRAVRVRPRTRQRPRRRRRRANVRWRGAVHRDGRYASDGRVDDRLLADLLDEPYDSWPTPKSTGKELFHDTYLDGYLSRHPGVEGVDLVATLTELSARVVGAELSKAGVTEVLASGGGTSNRVLMQRIQAAANGVRVGTIDELGVPSDVKEAMAFALIGYLTAHKLPGNVPSCTGADGPRVWGGSGR